jgi:hypothetical protein
MSNDTLTLLRNELANIAEDLHAAYSDAPKQLEFDDITTMNSHA